MKVTNTILLLFLCVGFVNAQEVLEFNTIPISSDSDLVKAKNSDAAVFYELNDELFSEDKIKEGTRISVQTLTGQEELVITRVSEYIPGIKSYRAASETEEGKVFSFTYNEGVLNGLYHESHKNNYHFSFSSKEKRNYMKSKPEEILECTTGSEEANIPRMLEQAKVSNVEERKSRHKAIPQTGVFSSQKSNSTIDIMIAYTQDADLWARSSNEFSRISDLMAQAMNLSQTALDNSKVPVTLRLVYTHELEFNEAFGQPSGEILRMFTASPSFNPFGITDGEMDEVHDLRNQYGADMVTLFVDVNDTGGVAWVVTDRTGNADLTFSLNNIRQAGNSYTVVHELGHNLGNFHSRTQTIQQAPVTGGVFHESVGYQDLVDSIATVMAYTTGGLERIPVFSNPSVKWQGTTAGTDNPIDVTNASLSIKKIKGVVSSYRQSKIDPPVLGVSTESIEVNLNQGESIDVPVTIENTGLSNLDFDVDFELQQHTVAKNKGSIAKKDITEVTIYSTSFESSDGYLTSGYSAVNSWRTFSGSNITISDEAPVDGDNHLRLSSSGSEQERTIIGPYLGPIIFASYRAGFDVRVSDIEGVNSEEYEVFFLDSKTRTLSSGIRINGGVFSTAERNEIGNISYISTGVSVEPGKYHRVEVDYNSQEGIFSYFIDSVLVKEVELNKSGNTPGEIVIYSANKVAGASIDIDRYSVIRYEKPYPWLSISKTAGFVRPDEETSTILTFKADGTPNGTYRSKLVINTNAEASSRIEIPIELTISGVVSTEDEGVIPNEITLDQNYPNPFNPSTKISYSIPTSGDVLLEVFNIQGQKVATLYDGSQQAGSHEVLFDARSLSSGVYIYRLQTGSSSLVKQMVLIK
ncbi:MAG: T9SS type A sorting domain-containing protein [Balneolaceae bacterium]